MVVQRGHVDLRHTYVDGHGRGAMTRQVQTADRQRIDDPVLQEPKDEGASHLGLGSCQLHFQTGQM